MSATGNTAADRNQLTSPEDRGIMLLADEPANLDNAELDVNLIAELGQ